MKRAFLFVVALIASTCQAGEILPVEANMLRLSNEARAKAGLRPLVFDARLQEQTRGRVYWCQRFEP